LAADVLIFSGGVSVGEYDYVKQVLDAMGMELHFWKVRQRPGKPLAFGTLQGKPVFGVPGNPVSSAMCFEQHVRPALATLLGRKQVTPPRHPAVLDGPTAKVEALHHFVRGIAAFEDDGQLHVRDTGPQGSNLYSSVVRANCIIHLPEGMVDPQAGTAVSVEWLDWGVAGV
jgi:molybdopterin molybdotransferase